MLEGQVRSVKLRAHAKPILFVMRGKYVVARPRRRIARSACVGNAKSACHARRAAGAKVEPLVEVRSRVWPNGQYGILIGHLVNGDISGVEIGVYPHGVLLA